MEKKQPFQRDFLKEAYKIYKGDKRLKLKKEHINAAMESLEFFQKQTEGLRQLMENAYNEAVKRRADNGLPPPPKPPFLEKGPSLE